MTGDTTGGGLADKATGQSFVSTVATETIRRLFRHGGHAAGLTREFMA